MTNRKNTSRALVASALAMLLCVSMLIGSTFAWFTDTATTSVNLIQSGTLDIKLVDETGKDLKNEILSFKKGGENVLWEPGCTWDLPTVYIVNEGNLAAKYKVEITGIAGDAKLNEVIEWTIATGIEEGQTEGHLAVGDKKAITISGHMKEEAGNDYQNLSIDGIGITVYATQDTVEYDSYNNTYDKDATYEDDNAGEGTAPETSTKVTGDDQLTAAIEAKEPYTVADGNYTKIVVADAVDVTINGGKFENQIVAARNGATVTIKNASGRTGNSGQNVIANVNGGSTVIFEGGNYPLFNTLLYGDGTGTVEIKGGYYDGGMLYIGSLPVSSLTITGGTFGPNLMFTLGWMGPSLSEFVPDTHQIVNNADGSATVVAK